MFKKLNEKKNYRYEIFCEYLNAYILKYPKQTLLTFIMLSIPIINIFYWYGILRTYYEDKKINGKKEPKSSLGRIGREKAKLSNKQDLLREK
jgi:hypothetical protein